MTKEDSPVAGYIAAIVFGTIVLCVLIGLFLAWLHRKLENRWLSQNPNIAPNTQSVVIQPVSIIELKRMTSDFSEENILGIGGSSIVYKGKLNEDTTVAVKRINIVVGSSASAPEFEAEFAVLKAANHKNLVALYSYCMEENEKFIVYEYMPQGNLSKHLFRWRDEGLSPLQWNMRLMIALDVAKGVEYLHNLAQDCFIHRDLKPSNILLGNDMTAKVADFGLAILAPKENVSMEANFKGTFGYMAPEQTTSGRVTTKVDVYSFGVILMELITGRKTLDEKQPLEKRQLVEWFRRIYLDKELFRREAIDPIIAIDDETLASIDTVAELAYHCSAKDPSQRPDMGDLVIELSKLTNPWKPPVLNSEDIHDIEPETLPEKLKRWQTRGDATSSFSFSTHTSIPSQPHGFPGSSTDEKMKGPILD